MLASVFLCAAVLLTAGGSLSAKPRKTKTKNEGPLTIKASVWGPTPADVDRAKARVTNDAGVRGVLSGTKNRIVAFEYVENGALPPTRFRAYFYDYTNGRTVIAEADFAGRSRAAVSTSDMVPGIAEEELVEARSVIAKNPVFGSKFKAGRIEVYEAMPPVTVHDGERLVNMGISDPETGENRIVGVSLRNGTVVEYGAGAPPTSRAVPESCGIPSAAQGSTSSGLAGQYQLTVTRDSQPLWEMLVVRPSSSSGYVLERSGLEIRNVKYKGKTVFKRAHAPVLNVRYQNDVCGPYRDWQYSEGFFQIPTTGVTYPNGTSGGFAVIENGGVPTTVVESRDDIGNFQGVAVYQQDVGNGTELVLVTEMNAGWYRYIMEWRFAPDGTIRPRYGFGSIANSCVCSSRTHHVYWRFDFDIVQSENNVFRADQGRKSFMPILTEAALFRGTRVPRRVIVQNSAGEEAYMIIPGPGDAMPGYRTGTLFDSFAAGDYWILRFAGTSTAPTEIDDPNPFGSQAAAIGPWVSGQSVSNTDVVVWYAAHQTRVDDASLTQWRENILDGRHVVGPDLTPLKW